MTRVPPTTRRPKRRGSAAARARRGGLSLLELVVAGALLAGVTASLHVVLRGMRTTWEQMDGETQTLGMADDGLRFITRRCREAEAVTQITGAPDGQFVIAMPDGYTLQFHRWDVTNIVYVTDSRTVSRNLVESATGFTPTFYEADGTTVTTDPAKARLIDIALTVDLPRDHAPGRTVRGRVWVRRW